MVDETMENPIGHGLRTRTFVPSVNPILIKEPTHDFHMARLLFPFIPNNIPYFDHNI
jgi:hypothetical protein